MNIIDALNWRYAVRRFAPQPVDNDRLRQLLDATRLSATSYGLQPYRMIQVEDMGVRRKLLAHSCAQDKVVDCSHLLVFAAQTHIGDALVDDYIHSVAEVRGIPVDELTGLADHMKGVFRDMNGAEKKAWAHQQVHIALGTLLTAAAMLGIDTCPMGGIEPAGYNRVLGLADRGLETSVICALGVRHPDDGNAHLPKVRYDLVDMVLTV
jgi:nitroreductase